MDKNTILLGIVVALVGYIGYTKAPDILDKLPLPSSGSSVVIVTVDPVRIVNAQRAELSKALQGDESVMDSLGLISGQLSEVIRDIAGPKAVVLVSQAVVVPHESVRDITMDVIRKLGLPENVPTVGFNDSSAMPMYGTQYRNSPDYQRFEQNFNEMKKTWASNSQEGGSAILP